ncbi:MAG: hypothetical protein JRJ62_15945 [Deltaproteobacteria bacterium]|nr:hypothetical protein [Deltaproteobacteria bacterium]
MGNMSYVRFENTLNDLLDCYDHLQDGASDLSKKEFKARGKLIDLCIDIALEYGYKIERYVVEEEIPY